MLYLFQEDMYLRETWSMLDGSGSVYVPHQPRLGIVNMIHIVGLAAFLQEVFE
jgi:hypothetical protein